MANKQATSLQRWVYPSQNGDEKKDVVGIEKVVPELLLLGYQKYTEAFPIHLHLHKNGYEFVYLEYGSVTWEIDGVFYPTLAGQWFYTRPGELHKARFDHMEPSRIWWFIIEDPKENLNFFGLSSKDREIIIDLMGKLPRVFQADHRVQEQFMRLKSSLEEGSPNQALFARYQVLHILLGLLQPSTSKTNQDELQEAVVNAVNKMIQSPELRFSIAEMAKSVRLSSSHFYKLFYRIFGQSPAAYMVRIRMERACILLKTELTITEIAFKLGFETSQHFSTVFKKIIGSSPSEWRKHSQ
jgi:AraC-like DNA-binding protein